LVKQIYCIGHNIGTSRWNTRVIFLALERYSGIHRLVR